jgi:hypothetical protein
MEERSHDLNDILTGSELPVRARPFPLAATTPDISKLARRGNRNCESLMDNREIHG